MQDKPLGQAEQDLLSVLQRLETSGVPVGREALSVEARGRGLEFGRSFARLKALELIEEVEKRPFFLFRLFGARSTFVLRVSQAGRMTHGQMAEVNKAQVEPEAGAVEPAPVRVATVDNLADRTGCLPLAAWDEVAAGPQTLMFPPEPDKTLQEDFAAAEVSLQAPAPPAAPPALEKAKVRAAQRPRLLPLTAFTETLGGAPLAMDAPDLRRAADPKVLQRLRDILSGLGIDLTLAGEELVADRMAKGATSAEALSQVVVYAFAHVVHHNLLHGRQVEALGLGVYVVEIRRELQTLRDAGEIGAERFDADMADLTRLIGDAEARGALAQTLLRDPFGGAAPPAVLPEDLRNGNSA